ncbi:MAG: ABC transporter ATP-binding protein [Nitrospirae bacterium]|nr:ABC transporter ATP-binding protein [Nitrospirota bacterium]
MAPPPLKSQISDFKSQTGGGVVPPVIQFQSVSKTYKVGFFQRKVTALRNFNLDVHRGEIIGCIGPNGAGKTTAIKILLGLVRPTSGGGTILGRPFGSIDVLRRVGFLPEQPYFYQALTGEQFLRYMGGLYGLPAPDLKIRVPALIERVGLKGREGLALSKYSRGMLQRIGLAQALLPSAEVVILDEPMTGLDPLGRVFVRDLLMDLRKEGRTIFFSTHILHDVEVLCDRAMLLIGGELRKVVDLREGGKVNLEKILVQELRSAGGLG